jgi:Domain of unknown function (DUF3472)
MSVRGPARLFYFAVLVVAGFAGLQSSALGVPAQNKSHVRVHTYADQLGIVADSASSGVTLGLPYSHWEWPNGGYFGELTQPLTIERTTTRGASYFWSHQFHSQNGDGGYVGLQDGSYPNGSKIALFSVWSADDAEGSNCGTFDNEGSGWTCRIDPYNWRPGSKYLLSVRIATSDPNGDWYEASVTDTTTATTSTIGRIHVPAGWGGLTGLVSWTEYFGSRPKSCTRFPKARADFDYPTANSGTIRVSTHTHEIGAGDCSAAIKDYTGGDQQIAPK